MCGAAAQIVHAFGLGAGGRLPEVARAGVDVGGVGHDVDQVRDAAGERPVEGRADLVGVGGPSRRRRRAPSRPRRSGSRAGGRRRRPSRRCLHRVLLQAPDAVVADDHHHRQPWRTSESTSISENPAAPSPSSTTTWPIGPHRPRRDRVAHPVAEAAVRAGVEPAAGLEDLDVLAGVRHEVAAVADDDRVAGRARLRSSP